MTHTINWFVQGFLPVIVPWMGWKWLLSENDTPSYSVSGCLQTLFIVIALNSMTFATKIFWRGKTIIAFYMKSTNTTHNVRIRWFEVLRLFRVCSILFFVIDFGLNAFRFFGFCLFRDGKIPTKCYMNGSRNALKFALKYIFS